jgi:KDO2-lipid IV(A) lauroyltransferase
MGGKKERSKLVIELEFMLFLALAKALRALPLKQAYSLAKALAGIIYALDFKHRRRSVQHLLHSGVAKTAAEARSLAFKNFMHMARVLTEIVKIDQCVNATNFREKLSLNIATQEARDILSGKPRQVIVVTAHLGNWELAGTAYCWMGNTRMTSIMRPLNNPKIGEYIYMHRTNDSHKTVSREKGIRPLLAAIKNGDALAIVSDQHANRNEGVVASFFGHPARTHATPALLHLKTGLPLWPCFLIRKDDSFDFEFESDGLIEVKPSGDKDADVLKITQMLNDAIEKAIRRHPEQLLWPDINRKHYHPTEEEKAS